MRKPSFDFESAEQKKEDDYETILSNLASDIQKRQLQLSEIRLRERRSTLLVTLYTLAGWVAYVSVWYLNALPVLGNGQNPSMDRALKRLPVVIGPFMILFIRRIVQIWYKRKGDAEEKTLQVLMKKRREKVEEIKKKTNYYSTRDLIQRYDESSPSPTPLRQRLIPGQLPPSTPQRQPVPNNINPTLRTPASVTGLQAHLSRNYYHRYFLIHVADSFNVKAVTPPFPTAPPRKQWYDKLADAILGDDDPNIASPSSRYALICEKCFAHNGLVKESMWEDAQYVCPKCNHFNASIRSRRPGSRQSVSPTTSAVTSPLSPALPLPTQQQRQPSRSAPSPTRSSQEPEGDLPTVDASAMEIDPVEGSASL
ncbi:hypothetical protein B0H34DRAFT_794299 [Crassisporium funariophilum]|nr:hypothetical protein B0H34DRAFT_794299 [Crassisporium funariophilum]